MSDNGLDLVIIGGGTGGYVAAIRAKQLGMNVAVVEKAELGGTCLHRGCIPSKALLRTAEVFAEAKNGEAFGVETNDVTLNLSKAMSRKNGIVDKLHKGVQYLMKKNEIKVINGYGRVMGPSIFSPQAGAVLVEYPDGETEILSPRYTMFATGSVPRSLPGLEPNGSTILTSDDMLKLEELPEHLVIIGAGAIGVEWASMLADFGVKVTLVEAFERILPPEDVDVSREVEKQLKKRGVAVHTGALVSTESLVHHEEGIEFSAVVGDQTETFRADAILVAVGRQPVSDNLGIEATKIERNRGFIVVDENYRTREHNIFAIGDVIGNLQLAHVAAHEGIHAVEVMAGKTKSPLDYRMVAKCTYSRPEVASIGYTEADAKDAGFDVKVGRFPFSALGKALVHGDAEGFVKIVADKDTDDILGVHMVGPHVTDMISEASLARVLDATPWEVGHTIHPHPTLSEAIGEAALAVDGHAIHI